MPCRSALLLYLNEEEDAKEEEENPRVAFFNVEEVIRFENRKVI